MAASSRGGNAAQAREGERSRRRAAVADMAAMQRERQREAHTFFDLRSPARPLTGLTCTAPCLRIALRPRGLLPFGGDDSAHVLNGLCGLAAAARHSCCRAGATVSPAQATQTPNHAWR